MATENAKESVSLSQVPVAKLRVQCDPDTLGFSSTRELKPIEGLVGQQRAERALRFGTNIDQPGYNLFVLGDENTGRHTAVNSFLQDKCEDEPAPHDWVYVHNFSNEHSPLALELAPGLAKPFSDAMLALVEDLQHAIPALFQSDEYREKRQAVEAELNDLQEKAFENLRSKAAVQGIGILRTPMGFTLAPIRDGNVIRSQEYEEIPVEERKVIERKIQSLQKDLAKLLEKIPAIEKEHREKIRALNEELSSLTVNALIAQLSERFADHEPIKKRLEEVRKDVISNAGLFLQSIDGDPVTGGDTGSDSRFNRYLVNIMIANDGDGDNKGSPLVVEDHPTLGNIIGRVEHVSQFGTLTTDFTMIRPGALHRANGGYLVLDARKVLSEMFTWQALKRSLEARSIKISSAAEQMSLISTTSLEAEPIPLSVKVVLIGDRMLHHLLSTLDPDFNRLFKVEVDFSEECVRNNENIELYARLIAQITRNEDLNTISAAGVARCIDELTRLSEDAERLSLSIGELSDLLREAHYWCKESADDEIDVSHVQRAIEEQRFRCDRVRERSLEMIERETVLIDTSGECTGQINGLAVVGFGKRRFGRPSRITARVRMGTGKVVDIERETRLGGPLHSKGVLILSSYLAANFALDAPMSLWASLVFEQSYGGVDGDSASSAELYALLSALSGMPLKQSLAVTGSVNQRGQVQAIGGVNEKIEGFFDICEARGLSGEQGVLIPRANVKNLMLRPDVVAAVDSKKFSVYAVDTIEQGIELLTGQPAGCRGGSGSFPEGSVNAAVELQLRTYAQTRKAFGADDGAENPAEKDFVHNDPEANDS